MSNRQRFEYCLLILFMAAMYFFLINLMPTITHGNPPAPTTTPPAPPSVQELLILTNAERAKVGVAPLTIDPRLNASAQAKADELARTNHFQHIAPDGKRGITYIPADVLGCQYVSENLAMYDMTPVDGWMGSPPHRAAILDPKYDLVGFANNGIYWTQHFCDLP